MLRVPFVLLRNLLVFLKFLWSTFWHRVRYLFHRKKKLYVSVELEEDYEFGPPAGLQAYFEQTPSFLELRDWMERIGETQAIDGVILETNGLAMGTARSQALATMFDDVRESGKHVVAHTRTPSTGEYLVATAADEVLMTPSGTLHTFGPRFDQYFAADALDRLGVKPQLVHIGDFKTASHRFIHSEMTAPQAAMMRSLHNSITDTMKERIAVRRDLDPEQAAAAFERAPIDSGDARSLGLVDHSVFRGRLEPWLRRGHRMLPAPRPEFRSLEQWERPAEPEPPPEPPAEEPTPPEDDRDVQVVSFENIDSIVPPSFDWMPLFGSAPRVAVMDLTGMIVMPDMGLPAGNIPVIDPEEVVPKLREVRDAGIFDAAILHINSPGGSALASDILWEEIQQLRSFLPVVAYCSDVAGSGGYYLSVAADHIVAHSATLTGSIGVVTGKMTAPDVPEKLGLNIESIYEHEADTFTSLVHPLDDELMDRLDDGARSFYRRFLNRVGQNRDMPRRRLHRYARGRVYTGEEAKRRGLIDRLGGLDEALAAVGRMANLDPDEAELGFVPHRERGLRQMLGLEMGAGSAVPEALAEPWMAAKMIERENRLALMPMAFDTPVTTNSTI